MSQIAIIIVLSFFPLQAWADSGKIHLKTPKEAPSAWAEANQFYQDGNYLEAIRSYQALLAQHPKDPSLYYNLANAFFKTGELGQALYSYEKALFLDPRSRDIRRNLVYVKSQLGLPDKDARPEWIRWSSRAISYLGRGEILDLVLVFYILFLSFIILKFYRPIGWVTFGKRLSGLLLLFALLLFAFKYYETRLPSAVILVSQAELKYGPNPQEKTAFRLPQGTKVKVAEKSSGWYRVQMPDGETGWIEAKDLGVIS